MKQKDIIIQNIFWGSAYILGGIFFGICIVYKLNIGLSIILSIGFHIIFGGIWTSLLNKYIRRSK